jgi:HTH-type transcriptional regulator/antitoxin HigA
MWNTLEANYRQRLMRLQQRELSSQDREWLRAFPTKALVERGAIDPQPDEGSLFEAILAFFGVASRQAWERVWLAPDAAFRRSAVFTADPAATATWLRLGEISASETPVVGAFDRGAFRTGLDEIRNALLKHPGHTVALGQRVCGEAGVVFVVVPAVTGSRASGAARWLSPSKPLIQLSLRYAWEDSFWFSFFHEAAHLLLHGKRSLFVDDTQSDTEAEKEADAFAGSLLIPTRFEAELRNISTLAEVQAFARKARIPPGIVVGRLHRDRLLDHAVGNRLRHRLKIDAHSGAIQRT